MIDFEADGPTPEASEESAATTYANTSPGLLSAIGSQAGDTMRMLRNATERGSYADASPLDRNLARNVSDEVNPAEMYGDGAATPSPPISEPLLPADEVNKRFGAQDGSGKTVPITTSPMSEGLATLVSKQKQDAMDREATFARYAANHSMVTNFGAGTVGFLLDPINVGSMFVPGIGEESILARLGTSNIATRTVARFGAGATVGAAQMAPVSALKYGLGTEEASDYDLRSAFKDMAMGAAMGAVAHAGFGGVREGATAIFGADRASTIPFFGPDSLMRGHGAVDLGAHAGTPEASSPSVVPQEDIDAINRTTPQQREAAMKSSVAQLMDGREIDVSPIFDGAKAEAAEADLRTWAAQRQRLSDESGQALADADRMTDAASRADAKTEAMRAQLDDLRQQREGHLSEIETARAALSDQSYSGTAERLQAIEADLASPALPAARRGELEAERTMLTEGAGPDTANLEQARTRSMIGGLEASAARVEKQIAAVQARADTSTAAAASGRRLADANFRARASNIEGRERVVQAMASRSIRRYAGHLGVALADGEADRLAVSSLQGGDSISTVLRDLEARAGVSRNPVAPVDVNDVVDRAAGTIRSSAPTISDVARQQTQVHRNGYAPGIPQAEFDAATERLYGPSDAAPAVAPEPEQKVVEAANGTRDPETEGLEAKVTSSPYLTAGDRAALIEANRGIEEAGRKADAYVHAGELLARGETLEDVLASSRPRELTSDEVLNGVEAARAEAESLLPKERQSGSIPLFRSDAASRQVTSLSTGETIEALARSSFADIMRTADVADDLGVDPSLRASSLAIGEVLKKRIGDIPVLTVTDAQMRQLTRMRMGGEAPAGYYDIRGRRIIVADDILADRSLGARLLVHEGLHAAFSHIINGSAATREVIDHIRGFAEAAHVEAGGDAQDHYGLANAHEFVSEAFSNPDFQRFLSNIPAPDYIVKAMGLDQPGVIRSMWDAFTNAVRQILGLRPEQQSLLDAAMHIGQHLDRMADAEGAQGDEQILPKPRDQGGDISRIEKAVAARGSLGPGEARTLIKEVAMRAEQMRQTGSKDPYVDAAAALADKIKESARLDKLDALRNADVRTQLMSRIEAAGGMANAPEQLRSELHGTYKSGLDSVQSQYRGLASTWQAALSHKLHALGIEKAVISGAMDEDIAKDLWAMNAGGGEGSGNKLARQAAEAIHPVLEEIKTRLNGLGARIGDATDYVAQTRHDPYKMRRAAGSGRNTPQEAFEAWWKETQPLLADKTFADLVPRDGETMPEARARFGRSVFEALLSGVHMTPDGISGVGFDPNGGARVAPAFEGTRNVAKKVSQDRTLFWKDGASWNSYMQRFGAQTSLTEGVMRSVNQGAKQIALMERFGTNPMANLQQIEQALREAGRSDPEALQKFGNRMNGVRNVMSYLDGSAGIPQNALWASIGNNVRTAYSIFDLGGVGVTHFASIWPTVTSEMRQHGISRLEGLSRMVGALIPSGRTAERAEILSDLGAYADGLTRDMQANWQPDSPQMGRMSSMANTFMKYTGIHYVFDHTQAAVRSMLSHNLARNLSNEFGALDAHLQGMLSSYGIGAPEWELLRGTASTLRTEAGRAYLTPRDVISIDPAAIENHLRDSGAIPTEPGAADDIAAATQAFSSRLADKLGSYFSDTAAHSTVTAGARERALLLGGTKAGSLSGETMRFLTQFKMWPVAAFDQLLRREIHMSTSKADAAWGIGTMAALSAASGYLRMSINDYAKGNPQRSPFEWNTMLAGLAQGGGLGIFGDFLFGEVNRMGGGLISTAGGPMVSDADSLIQIYNRFRRDLTDPTVHHPNGTFADLWPDLAHFGVRHVPFANLVYLKGTLDYMLWYHLYEAASPGWWDRTNRRLQKEQGRTMQGYAPSAGVPVGVPAVYMANRSHSYGILGEH